MSTPIDREARIQEAITASGISGRILRENENLRPAFVGDGGRALAKFLDLRREALVEALIRNRDHTIHLDLIGRIGIVDELRALTNAF